MHKCAALAISGLILSSCAGITGVVPTGDGNYMVAQHGVMGWSSGGAQKAKAFQIASDYCGQMHKGLQTISDSETPGGFGKIASAEVHFRCI